jgi:hypothetical protein
MGLVKKIRKTKKPNLKKPKETDYYKISEEQDLFRNYVIVVPSESIVKRIPYAHIGLCEIYYNNSNNQRYVQNNLFQTENKLAKYPSKIFMKIRKEITELFNNNKIYYQYKGVKEFHNHAGILLQPFMNDKEVDYRIIKDQVQDIIVKNLDLKLLKKDYELEPNKFRFRFNKNKMEYIKVNCLFDVYCHKKNSEQIVFFRKYKEEESSNYGHISINKFYEDEKAINLTADSYKTVISESPNLFLKSN